MQATIAQQLGLEVTTVANFFMNARRRSVDKWRDDNGNDNRDSAPTGMPKSWHPLQTSHEYFFLKCFYWNKTQLKTHCRIFLL